jgi:hypothetical protein
LNKEINLAPVAFFVYNRLDHTKQTLDALSNNYLAQITDLHIFCDNYKSQIDKISVENVRNFVSSYPKYTFKSITLNFANKNNGLAKSIINGVTKVVNSYGKIIVLEDDLVTSPFFLEYMNNALSFYENNEKVYHIGGWTYPINFSSEKPFLWRTMNCWGWATWASKWNCFEKDSQKLINEFTPKMISQFNIDGVESFWQQVLDNHKGKTNTWAIFWYASIFLNKGLCLSPTKSLVENIGFDGSGTNCNSSSLKNDINNSKPISLFPSETIENTLIVNEVKKYYKINRKNLLKRIVNKILRIIKN